jgi:hypothetical protein
MITLTELQNLPEGQPTALHQSGIYSREARQKPLFSKRHIGVCQKVPTDSQTMRNKIVWSYEAKIDFFWPQSIKCIYKALLTSADVTKCCTETQPKTPNSKQYRWLGKTP